MLFGRKTKTNVFNVSGNKLGQMGAGGSAMKYGKGGQALFNALKAKGYKKAGGTAGGDKLLTKFMKKGK